MQILCDMVFFKSQNRHVDGQNYLRTVLPQFGNVLEVIHIFSTLALNLSNGFSYYLFSKKMRPVLLNKLNSKSIVNGLWSFVRMPKYIFLCDLKPNSFIPLNPFSKLTSEFCNYKKSALYCSFPQMFLCDA